MTTQYYTASSLDGFIAAPGDSLDWLFQFGEGAPTYASFIEQVGAIAMGRTTYEWILQHPLSPDPAHRWIYQQPAWIFSSRSDLPTVEGADIRFVRGDVRPVHREMTEAAAGKNLWLVGGGELVGQFHDHGLLDELIVQVTSVTLGSGAPLLPRAITTPPLKLTSATTYGSAFAELHYQVQHAPAPAQPGA